MASLALRFDSVLVIQDSCKWLRMPQQHQRHRGLTESGKRHQFSFLLCYNQWHLLLLLWSSLLVDLL